MSFYFGPVSGQISNQADWINTILVVDDDTGDPIDLSLCRITMTVTNRRRNPNAYMGMVGHYGPFYPDMIQITGSTDTGEIVVVDLGTFQWTFPALTMNALIQGEYQVGIRIELDDQKMQLAVGTVTVLDGIDMQ